MKIELPAIQKCNLFCNYSLSFEEFSFLRTEKNDFELKVMESLLIERDKPMFNKADTSIPPELL